SSVPEALELALDALDENREPNLRILVAKNLAAAYLDLGQVSRARSQYQAVPEPGEPILATHYRWLGARLLRAEGRPNWAATAFREVLKELEEQGSPIALAACRLELAATLVEIDCREEALCVAADALPQMLQTQRYALQSEVLLLQALTRSAENLSPGPLDQLASHLRKIGA
ncbi:MAG: hypothetical protein KDD47_15315, partial [Acidobacteria bacterium]|nr:hypothetical protein [Acidobacteriota bacterium]